MKQNHAPNSSMMVQSSMNAWPCVTEKISFPVPIPLLSKRLHISTTLYCWSLQGK